MITSLLSCTKPTPVALPPEDIIFHSVERMQNTTGFHFVIDRSGAPAFLDPDHSISLRRMEGDFVAPDKVRATVRIIAPGLVTEVDVIGIGDTQWETNPLTGEWQKLPPDWGFNPAILFDTNVGLQPILESDLFDLELVGNVELDELPGITLYALMGRLEGDRIYEMSYGLIGPEEMEVKLWIAPETFELYRMVVNEMGETEEESRQWTFDFWDFDQVADIQPPVSEGDSTP